MFTAPKGSQFSFIFIIYVKQNYKDKIMIYEPHHEDT